MERARRGAEMACAWNSSRRSRRAHEFKTVGSTSPPCPHISRPTTGGTIARGAETAHHGHHSGAGDLISASARAKSTERPAWKSWEGCWRPRVEEMRWDVDVCWEKQKVRDTWHWSKRAGCGPTLSLVVWEVCMLLCEKAALESHAGAENKQPLWLTFSVTTSGHTRSAASRQLNHCTTITHTVASRFPTPNSTVCPPTL